MKIASLVLVVAVFGVTCVSRCAGEDDYSKKLLDMLSSKDEAQANGLIKKMLDHAISDSGHRTLPDVSDHGGDGREDALAQVLKERIQQRAASVSSAASVGKRGHAGESSSQRVESRSEGVRDVTRQIIEMSEKHVDDIAKIESLSVDVSESLQIANEAVTTMQKKMDHLSDILSDVHSSSADMHSIYHSLVEELGDAKNFAKSTTWQSTVRTGSYYLFVLQLGCLLAAVYYRKRGLQAKYSRPA